MTLFLVSPWNTWKTIQPKIFFSVSNWAFEIHKCSALLKIAPHHYMIVIQTWHIGVTIISAGHKKYCSIVFNWVISPKDFWLLATLKSMIINSAVETEKTSPALRRPYFKAHTYGICPKTRLLTRCTFYSVINGTTWKKCSVPFNWLWPRY